MSVNASLKKRIKRGFNPVDLLVILLVIAIAALAVYAYLPSLLASRAGSDETVEYTVVLTGSDKSLMSKINAGDSVTFGQLAFGTVKSCSFDTEQEPVPSGAVAVTTYSATITVSADARVTDSEILISGERISEGVEYALAFDGYFGTFTCTDVSLGGSQ